MTPRTRC